MNQFHREHLNPYVNFHRPCAVPTVLTQANGRRRTVYQRWATPFERFRELSRCERFLRPGVSLAELDVSPNCSPTPKPRWPCSAPSASSSPACKEDRPHETPLAGARRSLPGRANYSGSSFQRCRTSGESKISRTSYGQRRCSGAGRILYAAPQPRALDRCGPFQRFTEIRESGPMQSLLAAASCLPLVCPGPLKPSERRFGSRSTPASVQAHSSMRICLASLSRRASPDPRG